ncbi:hypothetical protein PILCRDRAFT_17492 [Piloderma croceum F 1598]|uniref:Uncharacterized protein n=1 Tax=Piloderma croceum (strain F 1598) TaxID=765440 RepID=A0A0C3AB51_PILCF|nr:hypothetical protein PILCRDRAFT_17492 [Piloderma croceum F 1598]
MTDGAREATTRTKHANGVQNAIYLCVFDEGRLLLRVKKHDNYQEPIKWPISCAEYAGHGKAIDACANPSFVRFSSFWPTAKA